MALASLKSVLSSFYSFELSASGLGLVDVVLMQCISVFVSNSLQFQNKQKEQKEDI